VIAGFMEKIVGIQRIVPFISDEETEKIKVYISQKNISILREETGMIMSSAGDSFGNPFFLGEILVCEAEVDYKNQRGFGMIIGKNKTLAVLMAAIDSASKSSDDSFIQEIERMLKPSIQRMHESSGNEKKFVNGTKVNFGLMVEG